MSNYLEATTMIDLLQRTNEKYPRLELMSARIDCHDNKLILHLSEKNFKANFESWTVDDNYSIDSKHLSVGCCEAQVIIFCLEHNDE